MPHSRLPQTSPDALAILTLVAADSVQKVHDYAVTAPEWVSRILIWLVGGGGLILLGLGWRYLFKPFLADFLLSLEDMRQEKRDGRAVEQLQRMKAPLEAWLRTDVFVKDLASRAQEKADVAEALRIARESFAMAELNNNAIAALTETVNQSARAHGGQLDLIMTLVQGVMTGLDGLRAEMRRSNDSVASQNSALPFTARRPNDS